MTTPSDRIPEFGMSSEHRERGNAYRHEPGPPLDEETRDVVDTFEALYAAELSSAPVERAPEEARAADDELRVDLPREFGFEAAPGAARHAARRSAPRPASADAATRAHAAATSAKPESTREAALGIEDAYAVLQAAESKGRASAVRATAEREDEAAPVPATLPVPAATRQRTRSADRNRTAAPDWAGRARVLWPKIAGAALIALVVGAGAGYLAGRAPSTPGPQATIPVTPEGAAKLQFDYELHTR